MIKATSTICYIVVLLAHKVMSTSMKAHDANQVSQTSTSLFAQTSPVWLSDVHGPLDDSVVKSYPRDEDIKAGSLPEHSSVRLLNGYPEPDKQPSADHPEVQAVLNHLDLSMIPDIEPRKVRDWTLDTSRYDVTQDPDCWWSASLCMKPKANYIPEDIYMCPNKGDWGLNFDDGPYKAWWPESEKDKKYDQPRLYNFLVNHGKQKATLFFVGSNVVKFPEAAIRALNDGHVICSHTWSHPQMTTLTNEQVVAQLYWTQKAIKQTLGITPKCWRPPYGDVDDRIRAIAWQMGMRTILWDQDSNDWNLVGGKIRAKAIDGYFQTWINARKSGTDDEHGHITLQHENSNATIHLSEKWLPKVQKSFRVMPIHQCLNDPHPYWEKNWVYPTLDDPNPPRSAMSDKESNVHGANVIGNANDATSALLSSLKTSLYTTMLSSLLLFLLLL